MSKKPYNILKDYRATGNKAVDGVASCIMYHRERKIALDTIWLSHKYFDWYAAGISVLCGLKPFDRDGLREQGVLGETENGDLYFLMDNVKIMKGNRFQTKSIIPQKWESVVTEN